MTRRRLDGDQATTLQGILPLARLGAIARLQELDQERAALLAAFPDLADEIRRTKLRANLEKARAARAAKRNDRRVGRFPIPAPLAHPNCRCSPEPIAADAARRVAAAEAAGWVPADGRTIRKGKHR